MHAKADADRRGRLVEPSVVQTPRARLIGGLDNAAVGLVYYPAVAIGTFFLSSPLVRYATLAAACTATAVSAYLAYSLVFITKMKCANCMTAHAINLALLCLLLVLSIAYIR
jgi:uncharacterized membrane protein